jgi:methionine-S-sulfoxide reductase
MPACTDAEQGAQQGAKQAMAETDKLAKATFAGGCFWCMQPVFEIQKGVAKTTVGYTAGTVAKPTYEQVVAGGTGHKEAIQVLYDPKQVSYELLLDIYWHNIDPTQADGQFADRGTSYQTAIFYHDQQQKELAEKSKQELAASGRFDGPIVTEIVPAEPFYAAEDYHQMYYEKNPVRYKLYKVGSGREGSLKSLWGDEEPEKAKKE